MALYGFGHSGFFSVVSPTVAEYFGMQSHGALFGIILFFGTIGGAIGPILGGMVFDYSGNYDSAFITLAVLMALGLILVLTLPKTKPQLLRQTEKAQFISRVRAASKRSLMKSNLSSGSSMGRSSFTAQAI